MAYDPAMRTEAFELYLLGDGPDRIARELRRRHPGKKCPTAKTLESWAYVPDSEGLTWSERRAAAEAKSFADATSDFVSMREQLVAGQLRIQQKLQERVENALDDSEGAKVENVTQEIYALTNASKSLVRMLDQQLAEEVRKRDAIDALIEACRRIVPKWSDLETRIRQEFAKIVNSGQ